VDLAIFLDRAPVADLGRTVDDDVRLADGLTDEVGVVQLAAIEDGAEIFELADVARRANDGGDGLFLARTGLGDVSAGEPGGAGDEIAHEACFTNASAAVQSQWQKMQGKK